ncbi:transmembrane protein, putative [Medicago truncatula]|uniref:Transmembrane protein, putative n=1 Tax=Medicago truncatula TaxID=3880 RepID=A0A072UNM5_MEDTR|nr:transmembrane protein, putative [Medicago truncatula]
MERVTLGDYERLNNLDEVAQGFQPANPVFFNIKNLVLTALKDNQYSGKEEEECNIHLTDLLEACNTIKPCFLSRFFPTLKYIVKRLETSSFQQEDDVDGCGWRCDDGGGYAIRIATLPCSLDGGSSVVQILGAVYFGPSVAPTIWVHLNRAAVTGFEVLSYIYSVWTVAADLGLSLCKFGISVLCRNGREFVWFVKVNCGCAIFVTVLAVDFICHPQGASVVFVCSLDVGQKWLINQLVRVNSLITVLAVEFTPIFKHLYVVLYGLERVINACCLCCRELMVTDFLGIKLKLYLKKLEAKEVLRLSINDIGCG